MNKNTYHHGNLRNELIQAGLKIINEEGERSLSLRKVASMCGVSHSAPKSHFANKEEFIDEIKKTVTLEFSKAMQDVVDNNKDPERLIDEFGVAYIKYFVNNPESFLFVTNQRDIDIRISEDRIEDSDYQPFQIFQIHASKQLLAMGLPQKEISKNIIVLWSFVNGLSGLSVMKGFHYEGDWMEMVKKIICRK